MSASETRKIEPPDSEYPRNILQAPVTRQLKLPQLYARGDILPGSEASLAAENVHYSVIGLTGSRTATELQLQRGEAFLHQLILLLQKKYPKVRYALLGGLSIGGDELLRVGLNPDLNTHVVGVPPTAVNARHNDADRPLFDRIEGHLNHVPEGQNSGTSLVSLFPDKTETRTQYHPLERNKIIAWWAGILLVTVANSDRGGTIRTIDFALQAQRKIYAIRGNVRGAITALYTRDVTIVDSPENILADLNS